MKELYNETFFNHFSKRVEEVYPAFDTPQFLNLIYDYEWEQKELKQRMRTITHALRATLPSSYAEALDILFALSPRCRGLEYLFFPDFVEVYGRDGWDLSITALEHFTSSSSSEFAVRPFIEANPEKMMAVMQRWAEHEDHHVRRLASEGCRPRLPWAKPLNRFKKDPAPILPILESLKADPSEYVRRSVANNLNDISKDHPDLVKRLSGEWKGRHPHTDWIIKHGCRTLLKKGDAEVLSLFGFETKPDVNVRNLSLSDNTLSLGESLTFSFLLVNDTPREYCLRISYCIDFIKANGKSSPKQFKITENVYGQGRFTFSRNHEIKDLSTRKHYEGMHRLSVIVNGQEMSDAAFYLHVP